MSAGGAKFWNALPFGPGVSLIAHDPNGLGALSKPTGVLSHPNSGKDSGRALLSTQYDAKSECFTWKGPGGEDHRLWLLNRLDSATSGVVLVASSAVVADAIKAVFARHAVSKTYNALVFGTPRAQSEVWRDRLSVERGDGTVRAGRGGVPAQSEMRVLKFGGWAAGVSMLELRPLTGRTHQLRVQCAMRHLPIVGDATYGDFRKNREFAKSAGSKRLFLHSLETRLEYMLGKRSYKFRALAPLPEDFGFASGR